MRAGVPSPARSPFVEQTGGSTAALPAPTVSERSAAQLLPFALLRVRFEVEAIAVGFRDRDARGVLGLDFAGLRLSLADHPVGRSVRLELGALSVSAMTSADNEAALGVRGALEQCRREWRDGRTPVGVTARRAQHELISLLERSADRDRAFARQWLRRERDTTGLARRPWMVVPADRAHGGESTVLDGPALSLWSPRVAGRGGAGDVLDTAAGQMVSDVLPWEQRRYPGFDEPAPVTATRAAAPDLNEAVERAQTRATGRPVVPVSVGVDKVPDAATQNPSSSSSSPPPRAPSGSPSLELSMSVTPSASPASGWMNLSRWSLDWMRRKPPAEEVTTRLSSGAHLLSDPSDPPPSRFAPNASARGSAMSDAEVLSSLFPHASQFDGSASSLDLTVQLSSSLTAFHDTLYIRDVRMRIAPLHVDLRGDVLGGLLRMWNRMGRALDHLHATTTQLDGTSEGGGAVEEEGAAAEAATVSATTSSLVAPTASSATMGVVRRGRARSTSSAVANGAVVRGGTPAASQALNVSGGTAAALAPPVVTDVLALGPLAFALASAFVPVPNIVGRSLYLLARLRARRREEDRSVSADGWPSLGGGVSGPSSPARAGFPLATSPGSSLRRMFPDSRLIHAAEPEARVPSLAAQTSVRTRLASDVETVEDMALLLRSWQRLHPSTDAVILWLPSGLRLASARALRSARPHQLTSVPLVQIGHVRVESASLRVTIRGLDRLPLFELSRSGTSPTATSGALLFSSEDASQLAPTISRVLDKIELRDAHLEFAALELSHLAGPLSTLFDPLPSLLQRRWLSAWNVLAAGSALRAPVWAPLRDLFLHERRLGRPSAVRGVSNLVGGSLAVLGDLLRRLGDLSESALYAMAEDEDGVLRRTTPQLPAAGLRGLTHVLAASIASIPRAVDGEVAAASERPLRRRDLLAPAVAAVRGAVLGVGSAVCWPVWALARWSERLVDEVYRGGALAPSTRLPLDLAAAGGAVESWQPTELSQMLGSVAARACILVWQPEVRSVDLVHESGLRVVRVPAERLLRVVDDADEGAVRIVWRDDGRPWARVLTLPIEAAGQRRDVVRELEAVCRRG